MGFPRNVVRIRVSSRYSLYNAPGKEVSNSLKVKTNFSEVEIKNISPVLIISYHAFIWVHYLWWVHASMAWSMSVISCASLCVGLPVCVWLCLWLCVCLCSSLYLYIYIHIRIRLHGCVYVFMVVCMYISYSKIGLVSFFCIWFSATWQVQKQQMNGIVRGNCLTSGLLRMHALDLSSSYT